MDSTTQQLKNFSIGTTPPANNQGPVANPTAATNTSAKPKEKRQGQRQRYTPYIS